MTIGLLCSGNLGFEILNRIHSTYKISFVLSDTKSDKIISYCNERNIPIFIGNPRNGRSRTFLNGMSCELLLSVNYLFIIDKEIISLPSKFAINVHGSLLPKYRGRTPHVWAIINNEKLTGVTAHIIDEGCDTGDIIEQIELSIGDYDTGSSILIKFQELYWPLISSVLTKIETGNFIQRPQDHTKASYFGKRTPEDGLINWSWQKERIFNWIRAQANPYPGAYTFINGEKLTIDKISFVDEGYNYDMPDGLVISENPLMIKTPNGVVKVETFREKLPVIKKNQTILR